MTTNKGKFLDIMKALAISCVLLGHCEFTLPFLKELIYSFHACIFIYGLAYNYNTHLEKGFLKRFYYTEAYKVNSSLFSLGGIYSQLTVKNIIYILYGNKFVFIMQVVYLRFGFTLYVFRCMFLRNNDTIKYD